MTQSTDSITHPAKAAIRALVIDDEEDLREMLVEILQELEVDVASASNGAEALAMLGTDSVDIIFCDLRMPLMDGFQFRRALADSRPDLLARTVFVSGDLLQRSNAQAEALAGHVTIEKPFEPAEIRTVLNSYFPQRTVGQ